MGPVAAERLGGLAVHQLTPELAEIISKADGVIFLDADATLPPGEIAVKECGADLQVCGRPPGRPSAGRDLEVPRRSGDLPHIDHVATPDALLHLAQLVYGAAPKAWLIGMGGETFELREGLSAAAAHAVERAVEAAARLATTPF
jgi:Ni,Fe-hydrogenase maturation factor